MSITPFPSQGQYPWYDQLKNWGADTQTAAENATIAADQVHADVTASVEAANQAALDAQAAQSAAVAAAGLVGAPAGDAVLAAISAGGAARDEIDATISATMPSLDALNQYPIIGHRGGGAMTYPEHTMETYRAAVSAGLEIIELDCWLLTDGAIGIMHDDTVDRTTTSTGHVINHSSSSWQTLVVDAGDHFGPPWGNNLKAPLLSEVLNEFGGAVCIAAEAKNAPVGKVLANTIIRRRNLFNSVVLSSQDWPTATQMASMDSRLRVSYTTPAGDRTPTELLNAGIKTVGLNRALVTDQKIEEYVAGGIDVEVYNLDRRKDRDAALALGVTRIYSDNAIYLLGDNPLRAKDAYSSKSRFPGQIENYDRSTRGTYENAGYMTLGTAGNIFVLQGNLCPLPETYTIDLKIKFFETRIAGDFEAVVSGCGTDGKWSSTDIGQNGYELRLRQDGRIDFLKRTGGVLSGGNFANTSAIPAGGEATMRVTVTPTQIKWERTDVAGEVVVNDTTFRGGYMHFGKVDNDVPGVQVGFRQVSIS